MEWLNYHHLLYFWSVAKHGTVAKACEELRLTQPTISAQIRVLEDTLGEKLFLRSGKYLMLTEMGRVVFKYADDIFSLGQDLLNTVKGRGSGKLLKLSNCVIHGPQTTSCKSLIFPFMPHCSPHVMAICLPGGPSPKLSRNSYWATRR